MTDYKQTIITELDVLRRTSMSETAGTFKSRVYATAIKTLNGLGPIRSVADLPVEKGNGLGEKVRQKIAEIIATGHLGAADRGREKAPDSLDVFRNIYGVGPKKAADLVTAGYRSIADLRAVTNPKLLNKNQQIGLRYYEPLLERIPREEMCRHEALLMAHKASLTGVIVGSYRRGRPDSGDIDMLVSTSADAPAALKQFVQSLQAVGYIKEILALGDSKCLAIAALPSGTPRRLDLLVTPPAEMPFAILYFTGSDRFNVRMRQRALELGLTLNEHGMARKTGEQVTGIRTERDIFSYLKMAWKEPAERLGAEAVVIVE